VIETREDRDDQPDEFICTGLVNLDMPLIRYRVGDSGTLSNENCDCGRTLPLMGKIEGRNDDLLYTVEGRRVGRLDPVFKDCQGFAEAQIIQRSLREINVKYVQTAAFERDVEKKIAERIRDRMGDVHVTFEPVSEIPRTAAGKFRAVVCALPRDVRDTFTNGNSA
jgi:phenylacetate-CoA ligase